MPSPFRNGHNNSHHSPSSTSSAAVAAAASPHQNYHRLPEFHFQFTNTDHRLRPLNSLILTLRFAAFCFSHVSAVFMSAKSSRSPSSPSWQDFQLFRFVLAANAIVAVYSLVEMGAAIWEILRGTTPMPQSLQFCFDFSHDQLFAYLLLSAQASGTVEARKLKSGDTCSMENAFCIQAYISVAFRFVGFVFLALSALISGYRAVSFFIYGSRFHR